MEIIKIEPTPNPNSMKITLSEEKEEMKSSTYKEVSEDNPTFANDLLSIEEINSVFHALNFISVDKTPQSDWEVVIPKIEQVFNNESEDVKKNN